MVACVASVTGCVSIHTYEANRSSERKLKAQIIPECEFRAANVWDVISFLNAGVVDIEPPAEVDPATQTVLVLPLAATNKVPLITFQASQISTYHTLRAVAALTDMEFSIEDGRPWLRYKK